MRAVGLEKSDDFNNNFNLKKVYIKELKSGYTYQ